jgi:hypothetical protein
MTSAVKAVPSIEVAVKHTPFTATESPSEISEIKSGALIVKMAEVSLFLIAVIEPSSAISPVNITHHS